MNALPISPTVTENGYTLCLEHGHEVNDAIVRSIGFSRIAGTYRAVCGACGLVFLLWDCVCELHCRDCEELGECDDCGGSYRLGSDDHNGETGRHWECEQ